MIYDEYAELERVRQIAAEAILATLRPGPMRLGDLVTALGFDDVSIAWDVPWITVTKRSTSPRPLSFSDSQASVALRELTDRDYIVSQQSADLKIWYGLAGQEFPDEAPPRTPTLREFAVEFVAALPRDSFVEVPDLDALIPAKTWVRIGPFVLSTHRSGWELSAGDLVADWAGHSFALVFPLDVEPQIVADAAIYEFDHRYHRDPKLSSSRSRTICRPAGARPVSS